MGDYMSEEAKKLFGTNGFRGVVGRELTPEIAIKFGMAVGTYFKEGRIAVGMDGRTSSDMLRSALVAGLQRVGIKVYDLGLVPTPVLQKYVREHGYLSGGVIVTASHNPPEYNGFKVVGENGVELADEEERKIETIFMNESFNYTEWFGFKETTVISDAISFYARELLKHIDLDLIKRNKIRIVADFGHGVSSLSVPDLLIKADCEIISINSDINGRFPNRPPEPTPENLRNLSKAVRAYDADLGVAYDGDGDRAIFCDEKGMIWWGDVSGTIIARYLAEKEGINKTVTGINSSLIVEKVLNPRGVKVIRTKVGSRNITKVMIERGVIWGFEENGGGIYGPHQYVRDGGITTMLMLQVISYYKMPLSKLCENIPRMFQVKTKVHIEDFKKRSIIMNKLVRLYEGESFYKIEKLDGIKVWINKINWVLIRPSGTEPIIRIFSEAETEFKAKKLAEDAKKRINEVMSESK